MTPNSAKLESIWSVLDTPATTHKNGIHAAPTGLSIDAGDVLAGVDAESNRHLLIPLLPGEAFAQDLSGDAVQLRRVDRNRTAYVSTVCISRELDDVFAQFAKEICADLADAPSAVGHVVAAVARWKRLFADASRRGPLTEAQLIGLLAELHLLEEILKEDPVRSLAVWTGPDNSQHDFRSRLAAAEVKATMAREGRRIRISSVEQLHAPQDCSLTLAHTRFERHDSGDSLPASVDRILALNVEQGGFEKKLLEAGYRRKHDPLYALDRYRIVDRRFYDVLDPTFPKITPASFIGGILPAGVESLTYTVDVTNEPPYPLDAGTVAAVLHDLAGGS